MNRIFVVGLTVALFAAGCSSSSTTTTTTGSGTAADTATATDTAVSSSEDAKASDTGADASKADTAKVDIKKDTTPTPSKCSPSDTSCLESCVPSACEKEYTACATDKACVGINDCLNKCDGVPLPTAATESNCFKKCFEAAGDAAVAKFNASNACVGNSCITCTANDSKCLNVCYSQVCSETLMACLGNNSCSGFLDCLTVNKCQDQNCAKPCIDKFPEGAQMYSEIGMCVQGEGSVCTE